MAKFYGKIGYTQCVEIESGSWENKTIEREYYGDIERNLSRNESSGQVNDDVTLNNIISVVADPYANENFQHMKYVTYMGAKWKIQSVEVKYPRLLLTIGGMYNENMAGTSEEAY